MRQIDLHHMIPARIAETPQVQERTGLGILQVPAPPRLEEIRSRHRQDDFGGVEDMPSRSV